MVAPAFLVAGRFSELGTTGRSIRQGAENWEGEGGLAGAFLVCLTSSHVFEFLTSAPRRKRLPPSGF